MGVPDGSNLMLAVAGVAVLLALRLLHRGRRWLDDEVHLALRTMGWTLIAIGALVLIERVVGLAFGPLFWFASLLVAAILSFRYRAAEQTALLDMLAIAAEKQMPLAPAVEAFGEEWSGAFGQRAKSLAADLRTGTPLADCLVREPELLPKSATLSARVGAETGALGPVLREAADMRMLHEPLWHSLTAKVFYLFCVLFVAQATLAYLLLYIVPRIGMIYTSFNMGLPWMTEMVITIAERPAALTWTIAVLVAEVIVLIYFTLHFVGAIRWGVPILNRLARRLDTAIVLRSLAWATEKRQPLPAAFELLARWYPRWTVRRKLQGAERDLAAGIGWRAALRSRGLIEASDAAVLAAAERAGNLPWALREMAASSERRLAYRIQAGIHWIYPLVIVMLGMVAFALVTAYFLPLIKLIEEASE